MPVKMGKTDLELERVMMSKKNGTKYFEMLNNFLETQNGKEHPEPQRCTVEMMKKLLTLLQEELAIKRFDDAKVIISTIQFLARFPEFPDGISVLLSNGLMNLLVYVMAETQKFVSKSDGSITNASADALMEVIMETINDVADCGDDTKREAVNAFTTKLMKLIVCTVKKFRVRMEALRTLNLLLDGCDSEAIQELHNFSPNVKLMGSMAEFLTTAGDFEMQVACTESLVRIVKPADRSKFAHDWFIDNDFAGAFMQIQDETFEADCRKFLNYVNESLGNKRSVFSLPCMNAYLGSFKLKCPLDVNLKDFWVDFNTVSKTITLYVAEDVNSENNQEAGMWETVTIRKESVDKFYHTEKDDRQALFIALNVPPSNLVAFCTSGDRHARIIFDSQLDITTPAVAVFGKERFRNSKYKSSVSQINIQVHRDEFDSPGPQRNIRSADENSDTMSIQNARICGLEEGAGQHPSGAVIPPPVMVPLGPPSGIPLQPSEPQGHSTRSSVLVKRVGAAEESIPHKVSVPLSPMRTSSRVMSETSSVSSLPSKAHVSSIRSLPKKSDFIQPKTPVKPNPTATVKRVKTPLQIVLSDKTNTDSGNESITSFSSSFTKKAALSSGVSIGSSCTQDQLRQKLLQVAKRCETTSRLGGGEQCQKDGGSKSDPGTSSSKKSKQDSERRQLRSRGDDATQHLRASSMLNLAGPQGDKPEVSAKRQKQDVEGADGSTEATNTRQLSRKKFRLYNEGGMMMESDDGNQDKTDADMVITSSIPTQESIEVIPESLPPSGQPLPTEPDKSASRYLDKSSYIPSLSVAKSPSLSTLTEESAQTNHSRSNKGTTPVMNEQTTDVESPVRRMLRTRGTKKSPISVVNQSRSRPNNKARGDGVNQNAKYGSSTSGLNDTTDGLDEESDADDEEDEQTRASSRKESSTKPNQKNKIIKDQPSRTDKTKATTNQNQNADPKKNTMPPSRAFCRAPKTPESSQDLSQLDFTSQMESHPKKGRPKKNAPKEVKGKKQVAQRGKSSKTATNNPEPKTRNRRAAAKMANEKIFSQSQKGATTNSDSLNLSKSECSTDEASKSKGNNKAIGSNARELTPSYTGKISKASGISSRPTPSQNLNQDSHDLSVYDFNDLEEGRPQSEIRSPPYSVKKASATKDKSPPFLSASQNAQDISVYDFNDSESTSTQGKGKQIRGRKKLPQSSKPAIKGAVPKKKAPIKKPRKKQQMSPEALSDIERPRDIPRQKPQKTSTKYTLSPIEVVDEFVGSPITYEDLSDTEQPQTTSRWQSKRSSKKPAEEEDWQPINVPIKKNTKRLSSSCDELSDIEKPRDAAPMPRGFLPQIPPLQRNVDADEYCDDEVSDFIGTLTTKQRQFFVRGLKIVKDTKITRKPEPAPGKRLPQEVPRSLGMPPMNKVLEKSASKSRVITISSEDEEEDLDVAPALTSASKRRQEKTSPSITPAVLSVSRNQQEKPCPSRASAVTSVSRIQKERAHTLTTPNITSATRKHQDIPGPSVTSAIKSSSGNQQRRPLTSTVLKELIGDNKSASSISSRSFGSQIIEDESEEIVARESVRRRYGDDGSEDGKDADVMSVESFSKMCQKMLKKSGKGLAGPRPRRNIPKINYQSQDSGSESQEELNKEESEPSSQEDATPYSRKRRQDSDDGLPHFKKRKSLESDAVSERSWLTEKPKQKVSTYSKSHNQEWVVRPKSLVLLDTTVKKPKRQKEKRTKLPPNQPKKKKQRVLADSDDDDDDSAGISISYYREDSAGISDSQTSQQAVNKTPMLDKPRGKENITQPISETEDLCPLTPSVLNNEKTASQFIADLVTPRLSIHSTNSSRCNSIGKSPKVTFDCDPESDEDLNLPNQEEDFLKSGPSNWPRPSSLSLKRKYGNLFTSDNEEEQEDEEDIYQEEVGRSEDVTRLNGQGSLRPKKLFKRAVLSEADIEAVEDDEDDEDAIISDGQMSSTASVESLPTVHITHMLKAVGENLKQKMMTKQIQAQKLTEGAVKSTQRSVSNLWAKQLQARTKCQKEFKSILLTEILSLETDLGSLQEQYVKMEVYLKQHQRKVASTLLQHVSRVKSLQSQHEEDSNDLNHELGRHLLQSVKKVLAQEMATMQKKLLQDSRQHELQQMKRGLHSMFMQ